MKAEDAKTQHSCPTCGENTSIVNLGKGKPREVCGRFGCDWNGVTLA